MMPQDVDEVNPQENTLEQEPQKTQAEQKPEETQKTPEEQKADLERELRKREALARLEEESRDSAMGRILRSKSFWYAVFGAIFFLFMFYIIRWAARDIGF
ncbi:MAG: hypothetical protein MJ202_01715 [Lentisphaeria bacterium]|nr:hypothetical protein [Lentisphaeria bacterium]